MLSLKSLDMQVHRMLGAWWTLLSVTGCHVHPHRPDIRQDAEVILSWVCTGDEICEPRCEGTDPDCPAVCTCEQDGCCSVECRFDSDCGGTCPCAFLDGFCEAAYICNTTTCACDSDCQAGISACSGDGYCDPWCAHNSDADCWGTSDNGKHCCRADDWCNQEHCQHDPDCPGQCGCGADDCCRDDCAADPDCSPVCGCAADGCCAVHCGVDPDCGVDCACEVDRCCNLACPADPDCILPCACDTEAETCQAAQPCTSLLCSCDPDCSGGQYACVADGSCDPWCPPDVDPDCRGDPDNGLYCCVPDDICQDQWCYADPDCASAECPCDWLPGICNATADCSVDACPCDGSCGFPCQQDGRCDLFCPAGYDPDCANDLLEGEYCP